MKEIDKQIKDIDNAICKNIELNLTDRGFLSQNILQYLRHFVEHISLKEYGKGQDIDNSYDNIQKSLTYIKQTAKLNFLHKFHTFLQPVASHYTLDEDSSERLMLKYYEYLLKIKTHMSKVHKIEVLNNIDQFPINIDTTTQEYYEKIVEKVNIERLRQFDNERYYIQKIKPFFVNFEVYYEVTFIRANDYTSKFDRIIAFTKLDIIPNYALRLYLSTETIKILNNEMPILIIDDWEVSIRPCEINNFGKIFGLDSKINASNKEYQNLMYHLTSSRMSLVDLILSEDSYYNSVKNRLLIDVKVANFFQILDKCRFCNQKNKSGKNVINYLLYRLNNKIIKKQKSQDICSMLSNLYLNWGCLPFEQMPFVSSLINHNPKIVDLINSIDSLNREHEFLVRYIKNNIDITGELFTKKDEIKNFENVDDLIKKYNSKVYKRSHSNRLLDSFKDFVYFRGYEEDTINIIKKLQELSVKGITNYKNFIEKWLKESNYNIDCEDKLNSLKIMFEKSCVALIYGSAGTGKSTMINHISHIFNENSKLYLSYTNPAIDNLKRKINSSNGEFMTVTKFVSNYNISTTYDLIIIDECSILGNADMAQILEKANFSLLILVGDIYQIESISFGNWFSFAQSFIPESSRTELTNTWRTENKKLLELWSKVRTLDSLIIEHIAKNNYSIKLDESIFENFEEDEIILCLNYDGLYGINNINKFLQTSNQSEEYKWGDHLYKINDPILFNETKRFGPEIYNNLKGKIIDIVIFEDKIQFDIELDKTILHISHNWYDYELQEDAQNGNSIIRFNVMKYKNGDEDDDSSDAVVPFQVAYAVSIHKAQGLEYNSVKIVITDEIEDRISHNIFYTAITRAKNKLKIYWSPETENKILKKLALKNYKRDVNLLKSKNSLT